MKRKNMLLLAGTLMLLALFSFKTLTGDNGSKTVMISLLNGKGDDSGFMITYSDGKIEKRPFTTKIKALDPGTWVEAQAQATVVMNEMREKGYRFAGSTVLYGLNAMVFEKD